MVPAGAACIDPILDYHSPFWVDCRLDLKINFPT